MYRQKLEYLRSEFVEENCLSAMTLNNQNSNLVSVGTPVLVNIAPFVPHSNKASVTRSKKKKASDDLFELVKITGSGGQQTAARTGKALSGKVDGKITASNLLEMSITEANELIRTSLTRVDVLAPFTNQPGSIDFLVNKSLPHHVSLKKKRPIIFDDGCSFELKRVKDLYNKSEQKNLAEIVSESLVENRYLNYTFIDVAQSNKKYMLEDLNYVFGSLRSMYPENTSFFYSSSDSLRCLIDTISISFYRLDDVIPIFDTSKLLGLAAEIFLTNSYQKVSDMARPGRSATYRFLFSKYRENVFSIDGELISRPQNARTGDILHHVYSRVEKETPVDELKRKVVNRRETCAE